LEIHYPPKGENILTLKMPLDDMEAKPFLHLTLFDEEVNMPLSDVCLVDGRRIWVGDAIRNREEARRLGRPFPDWRCVECGRPVRPHRGSPYGAAHFEHLKRNPNCSLSDPER
jgi:hypothetical protein